MCGLKQDTLLHNNLLYRFKRTSRLDLFFVNVLLSLNSNHTGPRVISFHITIKNEMRLLPNPMLQLECVFLIILVMSMNGKQKHS